MKSVKTFCDDREIIAILEENGLRFEIYDKNAKMTHKSIKCEKLCQENIYNKIE